MEKDNKLDGEHGRAKILIRRKPPGKPASDFPAVIKITDLVVTGHTWHGSGTGTVANTSPGHNCEFTIMIDIRTNWYEAHFIFPSGTHCIFETFEGVVLTQGNGMLTIKWDKNVRTTGGPEHYNIMAGSEALLV